MTDRDFEQLKETQLEIMDEIHRICVKHSIKYYIIGGTLLGAVRHKGFIPWDIDIDIAMLREDYENFKEICKTELSDTYRYCDHLNVKRFYHPHALICKKNTLLYIKFDGVNPKYENLGVYVDIFPLDNAPDKDELRKKQLQRITRIRKFKRFRIPYSYSHKKWKRYAHYIISTLLSWRSIRSLNSSEQRIIRKFENEKTSHVCSMTSHYSYNKQCMPREIYGTPVLLEFNGREYYAPERYEEYLTRLFKDYMKIPSVEAQKANMEKILSIQL